jgi:hypothetical protein
LLFCCNYQSLAGFRNLRGFSIYTIFPTQAFFYFFREMISF